MSKPYTDSDFSAQITEDRAWRLKEISDLKTAATKADPGLRRVLLRALVAICYAHWEGYVKFAAKKYLDFVALRKFQYKDLNRQFLLNYFLPRLAALSTSKTSISQRCALLEEILNASQQRFARVNDEVISTRSNLSFEVLRDICLVCSIPSHVFIGKESFVDIFLLKRRNSIAHGEETLIEIDELDNLTNDTIALMRNFGDALENLVYLSAYKAI